MLQKGAAFTAVLFTTSMLLAGCGIFGSGEDHKKQNSSPNQSNILQMTDVAEPPTLDSALAIDGSSFTVLNNVMEGLIRLDKDNQPQPGIAQAMPKISEDKKTYTFTIRKEAKWSDGKEVTAADFEYAWKRALNPKEKAESAVMLFPIENAQAYYIGKAEASKVGVKALNERTLQVKLQYPTPYFLSQTASAAFLPQRQDVVEKYGKNYGKDHNTMLYNGPFILSEWNHEQNYRYQKNPNYWDEDHVQLAGANVTIVNDSVSAMNLYTSGEADMAPLSESLVEAFQSGDDYHTVKRGATFLLVYNTQMEFFNNAKIRQALSLAVDRDLLVKEVLKNNSRPAEGMVPDQIEDAYKETFRKDAGKSIEYNAEKAKKLLAAGMKELKFTNPPTLELNVNDDDRKKIALYLQKEWKNNLGLNVEINPKAVKQKLEIEQQGYFHLSLVRWIGRYNDAMSFLEIGHSASQVNLGKWSNTTFDRLIEKAKVTTNLKERNEVLIKAEKVVMGEAGVVPLFYESQAYVEKPYVKNVVRYLIGPEYALKWASIEKK